MNTFIHDKTKDGWTLLEEGTKPEKISVNDFELVSFLEKGEKSIVGETMKSRAKELGAELSQYHAEYFLEHQDEIPKEWQSFYPTFTGTVWQDSDGHRHVACLHWHGGRWFLHFGWLGHGFGSYGRLVRPRKSASKLKSSDSLPDILSLELSVNGKKYKGEVSYENL